MTAKSALQPHQSLGIAVLTISDTRTRESDASGRALSSRVRAAGHILMRHDLVADDVEAIRSALKSWIADEQIEAVITIGGTGLTGRDVTLEAVGPLFEKVADGFAFLFHRMSYDLIGSSTMLSRARAGVSGTTLIFCLPGSENAVLNSWDHLIGPQLDRQADRCNLSKILPRLGKRDVRAT